MSDEQPVEQKVVYAVGTIVNSEQHGTQVAQRVEKAMSDAVLKALADGVAITDNDTIRARMLDAQKQTLKELGLG